MRSRLEGALAVIMLTGSENKGDMNRGLEAGADERRPRPRLDVVVTITAVTHAHPVPILALTAHAADEEATKSLEAGCTEHFTKPIKKAALRSLRQN